MSAFDLHGYLEKVPELCRVKFGRTYSFRALERDFEYLRSGKSWLVTKHVLTLFDPSKTPYERYWPKPNEKMLDDALKVDRLYLAPLGADDREVVRRLLALFHNLGIVSLILRFVHPDRFGIFSTNVLYLLQVQRPSPVELYVAYCQELRVWREHFQMPSVAETEMALWAYHEQVAEAERAGEGGRARDDFHADVWIQRRRAAQVLGPFIQNYGPLELARILSEEHPRLAGMISGEEYERLLRCTTRRLYPGMRLGVKGAVEILFDRMESDGFITLEEKTLLRRIWDTRNKAVHPGSEIVSEEVEVMIDTIERICQRWEEVPCGDTPNLPSSERGTG